MTRRHGKTEFGTGREVSERKAAGAYFTPEPVVWFIVEQTLAPLLRAADPRQPPRILEPACGEGRFLAESFRRLSAWHDRASRGDGDEARLDRGQLLLASCFGVEINPASADTARSKLAELAAGDDPVRRCELEGLLQANIRCGDALIGPDFARDAAEPSDVLPFSWQDAFPGIIAGDDSGFDAVVGNPPYVNIRVLSRTRGAAVKRYLQDHYQTACQAFDLYVLFIEKAFALLRPGGMCGLIVPNKVATLRYAEACRRLLVDRTCLLQIVDLSRCRVFPDAGVYPYILIWQKSPPPAGHAVVVSRAESVDDLAVPLPASLLPQTALSANAGFHLHGGIDVESRVTTRRLEDIAVLHSGTTGFAAAEMAARLIDRADDRVDVAGFPFVVSGNIDRYAIRLGHVRFMNRVFADPVLPADTVGLSERKARLYAGQKIVLAGMTRRLEAAWDDRGLALGVQVYAATEFADDPQYVLALLNSKLLSYLFRSRYQAKQLAGGFLAINKSQLGKLPIRHIEAADAADQATRTRLLELVPAIQSSVNQLADRDVTKGEHERLLVRVQALDREIDALVYRLYRLTEAEIAAVEAAVEAGFGNPLRS